MTSSLPDIPLIPPEVYASRDRGDLVLFCGAGVSKNAGSPLFDGLVKDVEREFDKVGLLELGALDAGQLDRFLQFVEQRVDKSDDPTRRAPTTEVRDFVKRQLATVSRDVQLHEAILKLSRNDDGQTRLVTTNFDPHFRTAAANLGLHNVQHHAAPRLVAPDRHRWSSVVYLHGEFQESALHDLVLTSGDFGRAYITERWAARFITELFENFDILFLGYSASDPVVRYVLDAFAAKPDIMDRTIWTIAPATAVNLESVRAHWKSMNVELIPYSEVHGHIGVATALSDWASVISSPESRLERVRTILEPGPNALAGSEAPQTKKHESQLKWLLGCGSIDVASALLSVGNGSAPRRPGCNADWLPVFSRLGLLALEDLDFKQSESERTSQALQLVGASGESVQLGSVAISRLSDRARGFATWMAALAVDGAQRHGERSNSEDFLDWIQRSGREATLHQALADILRRRMSSDDAGLPSELRAAWTMVLDPSVNARLSPPLSEEARWTLARDLSVCHADELIAERLLSALNPVAVFRRGSAADHAREFFRAFRKGIQAAGIADAAGEGKPRRNDFAQPDIVLRCGEDEAQRLVGKLMKSPERDVVLRSIAIGANHLLERALELLARTQPAFDYGESHQFERVGGLVDHHRKYGWTMLADLTWHAGADLDKVGDRRALSLYQAWLAGPHLTQRRLALHAAGTWEHLSDQDRFAAVEGGVPEWLVRNEVANEVLAVLHRLQREGVALSERHEARRVELKERVARQAAAARPDERVGFIAPPELIDIDNHSVEQLADSLLNDIDFTTREGRTAGELEVLIQRGESERLLEVVNRALSKHEAEPSTEIAGGVALDAFPDRAARYLLAIAEHERKAVDGARISREALLETWNRVARVAMAVERGGIADSSREELTKALNHPAGKLAQALFPILLPESVQYRSALDQRLKDRVEKHIEHTGAPGRAFLAIAASRLFALHFAEPEWTARTLVPHFDWNKDVARARAAWQGYLWGPRINRELYTQLRGAFLDAFGQTEHLDRVGEGLCGLLVSLALDGGDALEASDTRRAIRAMPAPLRATTLWQLGKRLEAGEDGAAELARTRVLPWLNAWPRDAAIWSDEKLADRLTSLALRSGDAIGEMATFVCDRPHVKLGRWQLSLSILFSKYAQLLDSHSPAVARLFDHVLPSKEEHLRLGGTVWRHANLQQLVDKLREAKPPITDSPEFKRLEARL